MWVHSNEKVKILSVNQINQYWSGSIRTLGSSRRRNDLTPVGVVCDEVPHTQDSALRDDSVGKLGTPLDVQLASGDKPNMRALAASGSYRLARPGCPVLHAERRRALDLRERLVAEKLRAL
jgi:hypothetical protein